MLPDKAKKMLIEASKIESEKPAGESFKRTCKLDKVREEIRNLYPHLFNTSL